VYFSESLLPHKRGFTMKMLLAVDGSNDTKKMLAYVVTHGECFGANSELFVVNVQMPLPLPLRSLRKDGREEELAFYQSEADAILSPISKFLTRHGLKFETKVLFGSAPEEILKASKKFKVDLIIIGTRGRSRLARLFLGSVAHSVVSISPIPVLVIR
jgi:nucleotide-binding universal stress UspA family protein